MSRRHARTIASLAVPVSMPVQRLAGTLNGTADPVVMVYAGEPAAAEFIAGSLFRVEHRTEIGRLGSPFELRSDGFVALSGAADLVAVDVPWAWRRCLPEGMQLRMPAWVSQEIQAAGNGPIVLPAPLRKEVRRHERRQGYELHFSTGEADLRRFHATLYRPYVEARHGSGAVLVDERQFFAVSRGMTLAVLTSAGEWVAGLLLQRRSTTLHFGWFGCGLDAAASAARARCSMRVSWSGLRRAGSGASSWAILDRASPTASCATSAGSAQSCGRRDFRSGCWRLRVQQGRRHSSSAIEAARFVGFRDGQMEVYRPEPGSQARRTGT